MSNFPSATELFNPGLTGAAANALVKQWYDTTKQLPGAQPPKVFVIANDAINPDQDMCMVDTEGGAQADNLYAINPINVHNGMLLHLCARDVNRKVIVKHSTGANGVRTMNGQDIMLDSTWWLTLRLEGAAWYEMQGRAEVLANAAQGAANAAHGAANAAHGAANAAQNTADTALAAIIKVNLYTIGEFKNWFEQNPPPGWLVRNGAVLANANAAYPKLWEYLHNAANTWKCKTLAQWNSLSSAAGGVGGVPFFVVDDAARTIKLPDTRGDYERAAGSSYLQAVGGWHGDAIRNITGNIKRVMTTDTSYSGALYYEQDGTGWGGTPNGNFGNVKFVASRIVPTASDNRTRTFGILGCVYVGLPT